jgi:Fe2+ or Zn2+ uptake regulation protein
MNSEFKKESLTAIQLKQIFGVDRRIYDVLNILAGAKLIRKFEDTTFVDTYFDTNKEQRQIESKIFSDLK